MKAVPAGLQDFKKLRDIDAYYVDKSPLIHSILSDCAFEALLFV